MFNVKNTDSLSGSLTLLSLKINLINVENISDDTFKKQNNDISDNLPIL